MASVTQTIPTLWGGVSQQSDELKLPGQVNKALNVLPDVTQGLNKRPGSRLVGGNITGLQKPMFISDGTKWFHYYRDKTEQYIGRIDLTTGDIKMFLCSDGSEKTVVFDPTDETAIKNYLKQQKSVSDEYISYGTMGFRGSMSNSNNVTITLRDENQTNIMHDLKVGDVIQYSDTHLTSAQFENATITAVSTYQISFQLSNNRTVPALATVQVRKLKNTDIIPSDIQTLTLNDNTFICNRNKTVAMDNTVAPVRPPEAIIELKQVKYASQYSVNLFDTETTQDVRTITRIDVEKTDTDESDTCPHVDTQIFNLQGFRLSAGGVVPITGSFTDSVWSTADGVYSNVTHSINNSGDVPLLSSYAEEKLTLNKLAAFNNDHAQDTQETNNTLDSGTQNEEYFLENTGSGHHASGVDSQFTKYFKLKNTTTGDTLISEQVTGSGSNHGTDNIYDDVVNAIKNANTAHVIPSYSNTAPAHTRGGVTIAAAAVSENQYTTKKYSELPFTIEHTSGSNTVTLKYKNTNTITAGQWVLTRCNAPTGSLATGRPTTTHPSSASDPTWEEYGRDRPFQLYVESTDGSYSGHKSTLVRQGGSLSNGIVEDLYFRVTTTGQSVATGASDSITYKCRYTTTYDLLFGGSGWNTGDTFTISMKSGSLYTITVQETSTAKIQANLGLIRPTPTAFDSKTVVTAESILGALRTEIAATSAFADADVEIIGNSLYLTRSTASGVFNISTPVGELLNVLTNEVQDIADLPNQCKHGYVVKVTNSAADEDDYFLKFVGKQKDDGTFLDGDGVWEECPEPGRKIRFDYSTMPVVLVRTSDGNFRVSQLDGSTYSIGGVTQPAIDQWEDCPVGSSITAPEPSFVGHTINNLIFFRNRLALLSDENIILSRPGDFFHFWPKSAITFSQGDNIDLAVSSEYPATIYDAIPVNTGLILFTPNKQFMLTTDSDLLTAQTAKINSISSYNYNYETNPFSLGTTIGFMDNAGAFSRFFEMTSVLREGEPEVIENTKVVPKFLPKELNLVADSRENTTLFFGVKNTDTLFGYRYLTSTEKRIQSAWFEWKLSGRIQYVCMLDDSCYVVIEDVASTASNFPANSAGLQTIQRFDLVQDDDVQQSFGTSIQAKYTPLITGTDDRGTTDTSDDRKFTIHLDNAAVPRSSMSYNSTTGLTTFTTVSGFNNRVAPIAAIQITDTTNVKLGKFSLATYDSVNNAGLRTYNYTLVGEFTDIVYGYLYDMEVLFPNFFVQAQTGQGGYRSDRHASLVIHRSKLSFSEIGECKTILKRLGKSDFTQTHAAIQGGTDASGIDIDEVRTIPIYEKNTNCTLTVKSTHPTPTRLQSLSWEGDYTNKFYRRV
jgi:hypothetical protein